jgi:hypothetical protein
VSLMRWRDMGRGLFFILIGFWIGLGVALWRWWQPEGEEEKGKD